ncbi:putative phage protein (TIGR02218 family) [Sphingomonas naasensis]|uniref:DUF2163 domain-containing protein n=1 Tax=Sphingomonas naasensis TaxID=1344951 RepID=A0A4S1WKA9_9SPHN|nr:DUF2163 domain-containing protein [Sphingomonas naasensis]NIJ21628.1 putative phage protein (TIGR02218 family) [Sphingomonas naasensis]TGX41436.1 DUF2163 domain-containing protein [Sphingomonas naasensis]
MSWLDGECTTLTLCWRIERCDGVTIGITAHDDDLEIDGLVYRAAPGMTPSAISRSASLDADSMDVTGALSSAAITEADLLAGRWDGARVSLFATDWSAPGETVALGAGTFGAVELRDGALTAELRGLSAQLERPVVEETSPECRAALGDRRCRVAMAGRRRFARVTEVLGTTLTLDGAEPAADAYGGGRLRWFGGANSGLEDAIARSEGSTVTLRRPPRFDAGGALVELIEGCDKSLATCAARFGNAANFRGEPYLPGIDLLTRYPGG